MVHQARKRAHLGIVGVVVLSLLLSVGASAQDKKETVSSPSTSTRASALVELAKVHNVRLIDANKWPAQDIQDILAGAAALPSFMRKAPKTLKLKRVRKACLYGMGRYNKQCPTFDKQKTTFFIYDAPPIQGEGSIRKLRALNKVERVRIQRQRAIVHALVAMHDETKKWSQDKRWKLINTWRGSDTQPFNLDIWGYSRYLGFRSARLDFLTFAEEFFVRPEDLLKKAPDAQKRLKKVDINLSLTCQQFTKIRHMNGLIAKTDPKWTPPARGLALRKNYKPPANRLRTNYLSGPNAQCPEFERWADVNNVEGIDLLLAAATSDRPESLYGHLLMSVRYKSGTSVRSQGFQPVYQYGAITDTNVDKIDYFTKGLFGGFYAAIQPNTFRGVDRLFLQYEQRTLRRYAVNLSPNELRRVMERLWEAERHITYPYYFMSDNCASMLIDLLAPAIDVSIPDTIRFGIMPTEVLDIFASVKNKGRGPLLVKRAETHFSSREVAMNAVPKRKAKLDLIKTRLKLNKKQKALLDKFDDQLDERDAVIRKKAHANLLKQFSILLKAHQSKVAKDKMVGKKSITRDVIDYLYFATRIERYFMDIAFYQRRLIYVAAHKKPFVMSAKQQLDMRRELFEEENLLKRQDAMLAWARLGDARVRKAARRPFNASEKKRLKLIDLTRDAYLASLDSLATIIETFEPQMDGVQYIEDKMTIFEKAQNKRDKNSTGPPGKGRFIVGGSIAQNELGSAPVGWVDLSVSMVHEQLGEQRRRGFRSDIESRALGLDVSLRLDDQLLNELQIDAVLFRFITIEQRPGAVRRSWRDAFGWALDVRAVHDGRRDLNFGIHGEIGYVYPLWQSDAVANYLLAGLFLGGKSDWGESRSPELVGLNAQVMGQLHLYGRYANVLRFKLKSSHLSALDELSYNWDVSASLNTEHVLADVNQQLLLIKPFIKGEYTTMTYRLGEDHFMQWKTGVMFELPF